MTQSMSLSQKQTQQQLFKQIHLRFWATFTTVWLTTFAHLLLQQFFLQLWNLNFEPLVATRLRQVTRR